MKMRIMKTFSMTVVLLALTALPAHAGWVATTQEDVSYYGNGLLKQVPSSQEGGPESIMNFAKGTMTMVDHGSRTYTTFKFEEFCAFLTKMYADAPPNVLEMVKQMNQSRPKPNVTIKKIGKGETIAGYATTKYQVDNNGQPERIVWMAENSRFKSFAAAFWKQASDGVRKMRQCDDIGISGEAVDTSAAYLDLMKKGWLMKEELVNENEMGAASGPVVKLVEKNLPASTFGVPKGYMKIPLAQFNIGN